MNKEKELQYYLSISPKKFGIYLFDAKNLENLYKKEIILNTHSEFSYNDSLKKFLDSNIFKIEKLIIVLMEIPTLFILIHSTL